LLEAPAELAAINKYHEANVTTRNAYNAVVAAFNKMLVEETIVYDLKLAAPTAEYKYEIARNRRYEE
jgi:hypothetical protein